MLCIAERAACGYAPSVAAILQLTGNTVRLGWLAGTGFGGVGVPGAGRHMGRGQGIRAKTAWA